MEFVMNVIDSYGLIAVFVLILLEYACFPLPSEVVLPFSGAVASQNDWTFFAILGFSVVAGSAWRTGLLLDWLFRRLSTGRKDQTKISQDEKRVGCFSEKI